MAAAGCEDGAPNRCVALGGGAERKIAALNATLNARPARLIATLGAACGLIALGVAGVSSAAAGPGPDAVVTAKGHGTNMRFVEHKTHIPDGGILKIKNETEEAHTFSLVKSNLVPRTRSEMRRCYDPGQVCEKITRAHEVDFATGRVGKKVVDPGHEGFDRRFSRRKKGDSVFFNRRNYKNDVQGNSFAEYSFICVIHPWMNGKLEVD